MENLFVNRYKKSRAHKYPNQFLYTSLHATGYHFEDLAEDSNNLYRNTPHYENHGNQVRPLHRVQDFNYGYTIQREDVNSFGQVGRTDSIPIKTPEIFFNFEYLLVDGYNESVCGFVTDGNSQFTCNHLLSNCFAGQNFFILTGPDGYPIVGSNLEDFGDTVHVVGIGNCFLNQYAVTAEVGKMPRARLSYEAFNIKSYTKIINNPIPAINYRAGDLCPDIKFSIPDTFDSFSYPKVVGLNDIEYRKASKGISPASIKMSLDDPGLISKQIDQDHQHGDANVQGFTINVPVANTRMERLGNYFEFARLPKFPSKIEIKINAILSEIKQNQSLYNIFCKHIPHNLFITLHDYCAIDVCENQLEQSDASVTFELRNVVLDSEILTNTVDDPHRLVELNLSCQISGPEDNSSGLFMKGKSFFPDMPKILAWGHPL